MRGALFLALWVFFCVVAVSCAFARVAAGDRIRVTRMGDGYVSQLMRSR